jgi:hypothetical protein
MFFFTEWEMLIYVFQVIKWDVEILFVNINQRLVVRSVPETIRMWQLIRDQVELPPPTGSKNSCSEKNEEDDSCEDNNTTCSSSTTDPYLIYRAVGYGGLRLYLKSETLSAESGRRFSELDLRRSLRTNLRDRTIVEHPVVHVAMKADECQYRDPTDGFDDDVSNTTAAGGDSQRIKTDVKQEEEERGEMMDVGQVWDQEAAMQADPAAYREYFDFYLRYYTQKYARQTAGLCSQPPPPPYGKTGLSSLPPATSSIHSQPIAAPAPPPPSVSDAGTIPLPVFEQGLLQPDLSPFAAVTNKGKTPRPPQPQPAAATAPREHCPRVRGGFVPKRSAALEHALTVKNKLNEVRAQQMREELRKSSLVAYDDSDSE